MIDEMLHGNEIKEFVARHFEAECRRSGITECSCEVLGHCRFIRSFAKINDREYFWPPNPKQTERIAGYRRIDLKGQVDDHVDMLMEQAKC